MMMMKFALMSALLLLVVGCKSTRRRMKSRFTNLTPAGPITLWLTKDGGSVEQGWVSPEQLLAADTYGNALITTRPTSRREDGVYRESQRAFR